MSALPRRNVTYIIDAAQKTSANRAIMGILRLGVSQDSFEVEVSASRGGPVVGYWTTLSVTEKEYQALASALTVRGSDDVRTRKPKQVLADDGLVVRTTR